MESPKLLDLIPKERDWIVIDSGGGQNEDEKKLELKLGPPTAEDWQKKTKDSSLFSLNYIPKASKTSKRGFEGCCPSSSHAAATVNAAGGHNSSSQTRTNSGPVVGWPPIRSFRKNLASSVPKPPPFTSQNGGTKSGVKPDICKKGLFVKINMDGIPIGRKVDLKAYNSYEQLSSAVEELFQGLLAAQMDPVAAAGAQYSAEKSQAFTGLLDGSGEYTLVYEDSEGDRMLAGDVPWDMFVSTATRLRVLKSSELSTLALGAASRKKNCN